MFGCGWVQEHGGDGSQFPMNSLSKPLLLAYWHLPYPAVESSSTGRTQSNSKPFQPLPVKITATWQRVRSSGNNGSSR
jgi:hypothetical protein